MMNRVYLSVGSNIQPEINIFTAVQRLTNSCELLAVSRCFVTDAITGPDEEMSKDLPYFINCVILLKTEFSAREFKFNILRSLESELGRIRTTNKYASRTIDLDILLFNDEIIQEEKLEIPDPHILKRWFLAQGILDIDPDFILPHSTEPLQTFLAPLLAKFFATNQTFTEDAQLGEKIQEIVSPSA